MLHRIPTFWNAPFRKSTVGTLCIIVASLFILSAGCAENENGDGEYDEYGEYSHVVAIGSENPVINYTADGILFEFYLLNEQSKPSTVFKAGENFGFYFKITNTDINKELEIAHGLFCELKAGGFSKIISRNQQDIGYPFEDVSCTLELLYYPFYGKNNTYELLIPWIDNGIFVSSVNSPQAKSTPREYLSRGKYYTVIDFEFSYRYENKRFYIPISFRINIEVK
jgi:hypothetical protein